jgi:hypothetical protein
MSRLEGGNSQILVSPSFKGKRHDRVADEVFGIVTDRQRTNHDITDGLMALEEEQAEKFLPRSIALPFHEWEEGIKEYFHPGHEVGFERLVTYLSRIMKGHLQPISFDSAKRELDPSKGGGLPYMVKKGVTLPEYTQEQWKIDLSGPTQSVLGYRTESGPKMRAVWMYSIVFAILEQMLFRPFLEVRKQSPARVALLGPEKVDEGVTRIMNQARQRKQDIISIDFKGFDKTIRWKLQWRAWRYIASFFQPSYAHMMAETILHFANGGLVTPNGVWSGPHGVPSGSTFTNELDSIAQEIAINGHVSGHLNANVIVQGDDGLYSGNMGDIESMASKAGLSISEDKTMVSQEEAHYLQNYYSFHYSNSVGILNGIYPITRCASHILFPDRTSDSVVEEIGSDEYYASRTVQILSQSVNHPAFMEFAKYVQDNSPYDLSLKWISEDTLMRYNELMGYKLEGEAHNRSKVPLTKNSSILQLLGSM